MFIQKFVTRTLVTTSFPRTTDRKTDQNSIGTCAYRKKIRLTFGRSSTTTDVVVCRGF